MAGSPQRRAARCALLAAPKLNRLVDYGFFAVAGEAASPCHREG